MRTLTMEEALAKREAAKVRYRLAFEELRSSYVQLYAFDRLLQARGDHTPGFGTIPDVVWFRHAMANPEISGSLHDDIHSAVASVRIEG